MCIKHICSYSTIFDYPYFALLSDNFHYKYLFFLNLFTIYLLKTYCSKQYTEYLLFLELFVITYEDLI